MKAMPATASNRRLISQAAPRPDQRVQIDPAEMPETTRKVRYWGTRHAIPFTVLFFIAVSKFSAGLPGWGSLLMLLAASVLLFPSWKCQACGAGCSPQAERCRKCTSFFKKS